MRHPAFDTGSDSTSRKDDANNEEQRLAEQKKQEEEAKKQQQEMLQAQELQKKLQELSSGNQSNDAQKQTNEVDTPLAQKASSLSSKVQEKLQDKLNLDKTPNSPVTSAEVTAQISAAQTAISAQISAMSSIIDSQKMADMVNDTLSAICAPIYSALEQLKKLPPMLKSVVDIDGAKNGMYASLDTLKDNWKKVTTTYTSAEVPITLDDYKECPSKYPALEAQQKKFNTITEANCLSSEYKKTVLSAQTTIESEVKDNFQNPEEQGIVAKTCEQVFGTTIKTMWTSIAPPIQSVAGIAGMGPIGSMVQAIIDMIEGIVKIAETPIPEDKLNEKIKDQQMAGSAIADESNKAANMQSVASTNQNDAIEKAKQQAQQTAESLKQQTKAVMDSCKDAFSKMKMPPLPDGIDESLEELWKAVQMVAMNIQNIFVVILFKLIESVFKCFNQIIGVIGVPSMPYPLNIIPQLITQVVDIMTFVMGLPMSLLNAIKAIVMRKVKAVVVAQTPTPPKPMPEVVAVAPTSDDVPQIDTTWLDVREALAVKWDFSVDDSLKIVEALQAFFDGSDRTNDIVDDTTGEDVEYASTEVLVKNNYVDSNKDNDKDCIPQSTSMKRIEMLPQVALEEWIPQHIDQTNGIIAVPEKHIANNKIFYKWIKIDDEWKQSYINDSFKWEMREYFSESSSSATNRNMVAMR